MNAEIVEPENGRYTADLVLLHGFWTTPEIWRPAVLGFAHRGWRCHLLDLRVDPVVSGIEEWCDRTATYLESLAAKPVLIGHDAGALVALALAERGLPRAIVASAPLLAGATSIHPRFLGWMARLGGGVLPPPPPAHPLLQVPGPNGRARLLNALVPEPARLVASVRGKAIAPGRPRCPAVLIGYDEDAVASRFLVEITARGIEAEFLGLVGGHFAMLADPYDAWMSEVQRWIIRRGGGDLLELRGDEDLDPDALI